MSLSKQVSYSGTQYASSGFEGVKFDLKNLLSLCFFQTFISGCLNVLNNTWFYWVFPKQCIVVLVISIPYVAWQGHF